MKGESLIPLVAVVGPTASGKTWLGIELAKAYNGEVVSADSMQIYKGMQIATAKPTTEEIQGIPHHLMGFINPIETFSVAQYVELAHKIIADINTRGKLPIVVGGTGLYINSLLNNIVFGKETSNKKIRTELQKRLELDGTKKLLAELQEYDPQAAQRFTDGNGKRIIRAIEIYLSTGKTMTKHLEESTLVPSPYKDIRIGLTYKDRNKLYARIDKRVDIMVENGLIKEAEKYNKEHLGLTAAKAIGYKELTPYFSGEITLEKALENLKKETRHYAKRQLTWFRRDEKINWIYADEYSNTSDILSKTKTILKEN
ncbi:tRNA dimethylallyltransferase [Clostridia bacterium]|nr:tRNA dimethylallyltransferase [Clostridia bacterium]